MPHVGVTLLRMTLWGHLVGLLHGVMGRHARRALHPLRRGHALWRGHPLRGRHALGRHLTLWSLESYAWMLLLRLAWVAHACHGRVSLHHHGVSGVPRWR